MTSSMFTSPCKIPSVKGFEQKSYMGLKATSYNIRINRLRNTEVASQLQKINSTLIWPVIAPEAPPMASKPAAPFIDQPLVSKVSSLTHFFCLFWL